MSRKFPQPRTHSLKTRQSAIKAMIQTEGYDSRFLRMIKEDSGLVHVGQIGALIIADGADGNSAHTVEREDFF